MLSFLSLLLNVLALKLDLKLAKCIKILFLLQSLTNILMTVKCVTRLEFTSQSATILSICYETCILSYIYVKYSFPSRLFVFCTC